MANPYFNPSGAPVTQSRGVSASMRGEFLAIGTGFDGVYAELVALAAAIGVPVNVTEVPVASGSTTDIGNGYGPVIRITGTTTINSFGTNYNGAKFIRAGGIHTLVHSASLVLPGGANITTAVDDAYIAVPIGNPASGWRVLSYCRMSKPMLDDDAIRASVSYSNPSWLTALAWSKITTTPTTRAGYGIVDAAGNGNNSDITSLSGLSGNIAFTGTGNRITGDFSNATISSRVIVQTNVINSPTEFGLMPTGTGTQASYYVSNSSDPNNASFGVVRMSATEMTIRSSITGTGTYLPITFYTNGVENGRIATNGIVTLGGTSTAPAFKVNPIASQVNYLQANAATTTNAVQLVAQGSDATVAIQYATKGAAAHNFYTDIVGTPALQAVINHTASANRYITLTGSNGGNPTIGVSAGSLAISTSVVIANNLTVTGGTVTATTFTGNAATATSATSATTATTATNQSGGTVAATTGTFSTSALVTGTGGIGYSTGAGGAVTQATSQTTAVTLNKPCGVITTVSLSIGAGGGIEFTCNNSTVGQYDSVVANIVSFAGATPFTMNLKITAIAAGSFSVYIGNTNGSTVTGVMVINFAVIKGVNA